jgi:UDP-GlcNAc:undecaprenyl-phosphate/decaprenyl-phosphate GlcNAc-1-phosphate transferase
MGLFYGIVFASNLVLVFLFTLLAARLSLRSKLLYKGLPLIGGIAIAVSFFMSMFIFAAPVLHAVGVIMAASVLVFLMGLVDDLRELSVKVKFIFQVFAACLVALYGTRTHIIYFGTTVNFLITVAWIVGITNAFNLLDIADGIAGGCALIACGGLAAVAWLDGGQSFPVFMLLALGGAICGFLIFNLPPAKVYLGNSGSHFIGFVIAVTAIQINYAGMGRGMALLTPLIILGFPVFDTLFLILIRMSKSQLPFQKTKDHIALRLQTLGYRPKKILLIMLLICLLFSAGGVLISQVSNIPGVFIVTILLLIAFLLSRKALAVIVHE